jgi:hypothetical protein
MSGSDGAPLPLPARAGDAQFVKDRFGHQVFYPAGLARPGYLVLDKRSEDALRQAQQGYKPLRKRRALLITVPAGLAAWIILGTYGIPLPFLTACVLAAVLWGRLALRQRRRCYRPLLQGLTQVEPALGNAARQNYVLAAYGIAFLAAIWVLARVYDQRIALHHFAEGTRAFYPDIMPLFALAACFGAAAVAAMLTPAELITRIGMRTQTIGAIILSSIAVVAFAWDARTIYRGAPDIVVTSGGIYCEMIARWSDITDVERDLGRRGADFARLVLSPARVRAGNLPLTALFGQVSCGLNHESAAQQQIYETIHSTWRANAGRKSVSPEELADLIPVGATSAEVTTALGPPLPLKVTAGTILFYGSKDPADKLWHVVGVHLDDSGRVTRVARYYPRGSEIIDAETEAPLANEEELPFLQQLMRAGR